MAGRRGRANREAILAAAYEAIATLGYAGATTAEICRRADVSSGTFFHYFPTKEQVLLALLVDDAADEEPPSLQAIVAAAAAEAADPLMPAFAREVSALSRLPRVQEVLTEQERARRARLLAAVATERDAGRVRDDVDDAELARRAELAITGFEAMVATGGEPSALTSTLHAMLGVGLSWRD